MLGAFGRYGVFAASQWPLLAKEPFVTAAFKMYRDYDGNNGSFGDISVKATTSSVADTSVYASRDSAHANRIVVVALNKTDHAITANATIAHANALAGGTAYKLTAAAAAPKPAGALATSASGFSYVMPAYSVNTLVLTTH